MAYKLRLLWHTNEPPLLCHMNRFDFVFNLLNFYSRQVISGLVARAIRNVIRANRFARIIRNWNPYFYSVSGRFARITRISDSRESGDSRESCESIRANHGTKISGTCMFFVYWSGSWGPLILGYGFSAYSWKPPAYKRASLLEVVFGSFLLMVGAFSLTFGAFWWAASIRHLMWKTLCNFETQIWLEVITSCDAKSACFKGSQTSCTEINSGFFLPNFGRKRPHHVMDACCWFYLQLEPFHLQLELLCLRWECVY